MILKIICFFIASLWYSLVSCLVIFSNIATSWNTVLTNLPRGFDPEFCQIVLILYINHSEVLYCKHFLFFFFFWNNESWYVQTLVSPPLMHCFVNNGFRSLPQWCFVRYFIQFCNLLLHQLNQKQSSMSLYFVRQMLLSYFDCHKCFHSIVIHPPYSWYKLHFFE